MGKEGKKQDNRKELNHVRWMRLDNAAKIYPAARRRNWINLFRVSATLTETVDVAVLKNALEVTMKRFPSIAVRLRRGVFWYYLEQVTKAPEIRDEYSYPITWMSKKETAKCAFRIIVHDRRIALEIFHSLTDGTGAMIFLKSLLAEYLEEKYAIQIPKTDGVLDRKEEPLEEELEDSFQKYAGKLCASRKENTAWHMTGTPEMGGFQHNVCFKLPANVVVDKAHEKGLSVTMYLSAIMMQALQNDQKEKVSNQKRRRPIKVLIPVNLRNLFPSRSLRNFALYTTPEILPRLGEYTFDEICQEVKGRMNLEITPKQMSMKIATNVSSERIMAVRVMPLFIKNLVMKAVFNAVGERKSCLSFSNMGVVKVPEEMEQYIERMDFIPGVQASAPYNCGILTIGNVVYINFIRNVKEADLEYHFYKVLEEMGIPAEVESNQASK